MGARWRFWCRDCEAKRRERVCKGCGTRTVLFKSQRRKKDL